MAKIVTAPIRPLEQPSPWAEDWLDVDQVLEAAQRGLSDDELLGHLGTVAAVRYAAALRAMPHQVTQPVSR
jgi:hypothetical protein